MSYILSALNRQQNGQSPSSASSSALPSQASSPLQSPLTSHDKSQSIAWGVLLTVAIFAALMARYWLGQHQHEQNAAPIKVVNPTPTMVLSEQPILSVATPAPTSMPAPIVMANTLASVKPLAAEKLFDGQPLSDNHDRHSKPLPAKQSAAGSDEHLLISADKASTPTQFTVSAENGVSSELLEKFQSAIEETAPESAFKNSNAVIDDENITASESSKKTVVKTLTEMPDWVQNGVPKLQFDLHIYASDGQSWIRVNGDDKRQGDTIAEDLVLTAILPQQVMLTYRGEQFSLPALTNWH